MQNTVVIKNANENTALDNIRRRAIKGTLIFNKAELFSQHPCGLTSHFSALFVKNVRENTALASIQRRAIKGTVILIELSCFPQLLCSLTSHFIVLMAKNVRENTALATTKQLPDMTKYDTTTRTEITAL